MSVLFRESAAERDAAIIGNRHGHRARLMARLGDGRNWEFTGDVCELPHATGVCSCGHTGLKYLFQLRNTATGDTAVVGSSCIEVYSEANPELVASVGAAMEAKLAEAAERRKAAKAAAQQREVTEALAKLTALAYRLDEKLAVAAREFTYRDYFGNDCKGFTATRRVSYRVWREWHTADIAAMRLANRQEVYPFRWRQYTRPSAFLKAINVEIAKVESLLAGELWS